MSMIEFYSKVGPLLSYKIEKQGVSPRAKHVVIYTYKEGEAQYDGYNWSFSLKK